MTTRAPFLSTPYGAYHHRDVPAEDAELTHVGPGTPCGEYFRRFWSPVIRSDDLKDLPRRIRILGEDLVVFRDRRGRIGLLELHCAHRGTSLEFGLISQEGIRCCYHGWLFDVDGKVLETPGEPVDSTLRDRLYHGAYPTMEYKGLVFAYMGPPEKKPSFPMYDTFMQPGFDSWAGTADVWPCNWLQVKENGMDPAHLYFLHTIISGAQVPDEIAEDFAQLPELDYMETPVGMVYIDTRRVGDKIWIRIGDYMPPHMHQFAPSGQLDKTEDFYGRPELAAWVVPVDDNHTAKFILRHSLVGQGRPSDIRFGQSVNRSYEERQREPGDYDAQTSQRPTAVHGLEHLGATDRGVIMLRNIVRQGIRAVQNGEDPQPTQHRDSTPIPTYARDTIVEMPAASTPEADRQLLRDTARKVVEGYLANPASVAGPNG